jgi:uncharacterized protein
MFFKRDLEKVLLEYANFPVIVLQGPRQSGKTTLVKNSFKKHRYLSFEDPETRSLAENDPRAFLRIHKNKNGIIIDEFQYVPQILSYIQLEVDEFKRPGYFVLTGSQNFLMNQAITQSLAGRVGILSLLPFSLHELAKNKIVKDKDVDTMVFYGGYPRLYTDNITPQQLYPSYIQSYIERDVRQLTNVGDLRSFQRFMKLCAGRVGQLLNLSEIASVCGISVSTTQRWISILEASYILFLLQPHFKNFNKRITKSPKIHFFDTGLACSLLGIESPEQLAKHPLKGNIFESFVVSDLYKQYLNIGKRPPLYFWRDLNGRFEVDCLLEEGEKLIPIEIKSGESISRDFFKGLSNWGEMSKTPPSMQYLAYAGHLTQERSSGNLVSLKEIGTLIEKIRAKK